MESMTRIEVADLAASAEQLPPLPATSAEIITVLSDPLFEVSHLIRLVTLEPTLTSHLLKIANSAAHGVPHTVSSVGEAVVRLGSGTVLAMSLAISTKPLAMLDVSAFGLSVSEFWRHGIASVAAAETMQNRRISHFGPGFCTAALLHDFGKIILASHICPEQLQQMREYRESMPGTDAIQAEREILGVDHATAGGIVTRYWKLPDDVTLAIEQHHNEVDWKSDLQSGVILANQIAHDIESVDDFSFANSENVAEAMLTLGVDEDAYRTVSEESRSRFELLLTLFG